MPGPHTHIRLFQKKKTYIRGRLNNFFPKNIKKLYYCDPTTSEAVWAERGGTYFERLKLQADGQIQPAGQVPIKPACHPSFPFDHFLTFQLQIRRYLCMHGLRHDSIPIASCPVATKIVGGASHSLQPSLLKGCVFDLYLNFMHRMFEH